MKCSFTRLDPTKNKFLILGDHVIRSGLTDPVIAKLDPFFEKANRKARVSSIYRSPSYQLQIIRHYLKANKLDKIYVKAMTDGLNQKIKWGGETIYSWQVGWSKLLNIGILINPPMRAKVLLDYYRHGINKKGEIIGESQHSTGRAFDISGRWKLNNTTNEWILEEVKKIVADAIAVDPDLGIIYTLIEHGNDCSHQQVAG